VVNLDEVYITADVAETYLNRIRAGDSVSVEVPVLGLERSAVIYRTSSLIDPDSRSFSVRVNLANRDNKLQPNLMVQIKMRTLRVPEALIVPSILVKRDFEGDFIFVGEANEDGQMVARKRYITTGAKDNNRLVVTEGLEVGNQLISEGFAQVVDGSLLNVYP
jgi:multidrug efflux pump subunit AcrA (membrane-fusion protein)